jgi:hypothetical protein
MTEPMYANTQNRFAGTIPDGVTKERGGLPIGLVRLTPVRRGWRHYAAFLRCPWLL